MQPEVEGIGTAVFIKFVFESSIEIRFIVVPYSLLPLLI